MKKRAIIIIMSAVILLSALISSCAGLGRVEAPTDNSTETDSSAERIRELEAQIVLLLQNQQLSENERKKELAQLREEISRLSGTTDAAPAETLPPAAQSFVYTLQDGRAVISKINSDAKSIVIPSSIDGYAVSAIGSEALSSSTVESVTVSAGIEKIDWFAFKNCISLSSVSLPDSITSIGYGAFDNTAKSFTLICSRDSFAHRYAQSYGLTYDIK